MTTDDTDDTPADTDDTHAQPPAEANRPTDRDVAARTIEAAAPEEFGLTQVWWGDGKGKTTAALGMGFRAAGHGYRVHMLQFMKGGASSVEDVRGEYNAIAHFPGFSYENTGHYGWHGLLDDSDDDDHRAKAEGGLRRTRDLLDAAHEADLRAPIQLDSPPEAGMHMLVLDEILYAADRGLLAPADVVDLVESKPDALELVLTGSHDRPAYLTDHADLVTRVQKEKHPIEAGQSARKGTEY